MLVRTNQDNMIIKRDLFKNKQIGIMFKIVDITICDSKEEFQQS
jgi:hypothetical protein